jgi:flagellar biosynthetic protein FliQ
VNGAITTLVQEGFLILTWTGGPMVVALLIAGLLVGIFQAATQIHDPAIGFLPRLLVALGGAWMLGGWVLERLAQYFASALTRMAQLQ